MPRKSGPIRLHYSPQFSACDQGGHFNETKYYLSWSNSQNFYFQLLFLFSLRFKIYSIRYSFSQEIFLLYLNIFVDELNIKYFLLLIIMQFHSIKYFPRQDQNAEMLLSVSGGRGKTSSLASSSLLGMVSSLKSTETAVRINTSVEDMGCWLFRSPDEFYH